MGLFNFFKKDNNTDSGTKSFWKRPEGVTGFLFGGAILLGLGWLAWTFLPAITVILSNAIYAVIFFIILAGLLYMIFDRKFRTLIWYMYKVIMRKITGWFVNIDPIGILETYVENLYKNLRDMDMHIGKLKGQMQKLKTIVDTNQREMEQSLQLAEAAKKKGNMDVVVINTRQYGRLEDSNKRYKELLAKMEILYRILSKMYTNSGYLVKDIENEVRIRKQEREAIKSGYSAMKSAMNIIKGDPDKKQMFDQAMEAIVDDVSNKVGEMERFMEVSATFIDSIDIQNGVYEQKGLELLEKMEKEGISFLLDDKVKKLPQPGTDDKFDLNAIKEPIKETDKKAGDDKDGNNYDNLFNS
jgi:phage shock protein A